MPEAQTGRQPPEGRQPRRTARRAIGRLASRDVEPKFGLYSLLAGRLELLPLLPGDVVTRRLAALKLAAPGSLFAQRGLPLHLGQEDSEWLPPQRSRPEAANALIAFGSARVPGAC